MIEVAPYRRIGPPRLSFVVDRFGAEEPSSQPGHSHSAPPARQFLDPSSVVSKTVAATPPQPYVGLPPGILCETRAGVVPRAPQRGTSGGVGLQWLCTIEARVPLANMEGVMLGANSDLLSSRAMCVSIAKS